MNLMSLLSGKGFVMYNKSLAHSVSVNGAIIFGQLCSSCESFGSKGMLTVRDGKEYFFLTSETIEEETALTYKQQLKSIKELEQAGYIESKLMGVPSKKYFHITNKIAKEVLLESNPSSDKREDLNVSALQEQEGQKVTPSFDLSEALGVIKGNDKPLQKGSTIKKKKEKEQIKNKQLNNCNYKEPSSDLNSTPLTIQDFKKLLIKSANEFYKQFALTRWSKKEWNTLVNKFADDTIESGRYKNVPQHKIKAYVYRSLEKMANNADYKRSDEFAEYQEIMRELARAEPVNNSPFLSASMFDDDLPY